MSKQFAAMSPSDSGLTDPIVVGKIGAPYGIRGWLKVFSCTENLDTIFDYQPWFIHRAGQWQQLVLESWRHHNHDLIIKLENIEDRDTASSFTNCEILVEASQLPALENGDYYWKDLIGCQVVTVQGYNLGTVSELMETGSNDVLVVKANLKDAFAMRERLLPFLDGQVVKQVDLTRRIIEVDWDPAF